MKSERISVKSSTTVKTNLNFIENFLFKTSSVQFHCYSAALTREREREREILLKIIKNPHVSVCFVQTGARRRYCLVTGLSKKFCSGVKCKL